MLFYIILGLVKISPASIACYCVNGLQYGFRQQRLGRTAKNVKTDRSKRIWSVREEEILMATLKDLAENRWRRDNGYRAGYLTCIKEAIKREFPNTDILPHTHIYSKITTCKRNYESLMMMLNHSSIGFNSDGNYKIEYDNEQ